MKFEGQNFNELNRKARLNILVNCIIHTPLNMGHCKLQSWTNSPQQYVKLPLDSALEAQCILLCYF